MRLLNDKQFEADVEEHIRTGYSQAEGMFVSWVKLVYSKFMFKEEQGWVFPVVAKPPPMIEGIGVQRGMYVDPKPLARINLTPQSEYDLKDASAGTLYYYQPSIKTLATKLPELMLIRDYMVNNLFDSPTTDVRKFSYKDTKSEADKWHADIEARLAKQKKMEFATLSVGNDYLHIADCAIEGVEYTILRLVSKKALDVESNNMHHCVYTYDKQIYENNGSHTVILSMRGECAVEKPLVTVELHVQRDRARVVQMKGLCNEPADIYIPGLTTNIIGILDRLWSSQRVRDVLGPLTRPNTDQDGTQTFTMRY